MNTLQDDDLVAPCYKSVFRARAICSSLPPPVCVQNISEVINGFLVKFLGGVGHVLKNNYLYFGGDPNPFPIFHPPPCNTFSVVY